MTAVHSGSGKKILLIGVALCCFCWLLACVPEAEAAANIANAAMEELYTSIADACEGWLGRAGEIALGILAVTAVIGFAIGVKDLLLGGQLSLDGIVALFVRYAFIVGLLVWLLQAPQRLALITLSIKKIGASISGQDISFGSLVTLFNQVTHPLVEFTVGLGWRDIGLIICMVFAIFLINCLFFLIIATVLMVEIEAIFILIGGLFTASFFVIGYFREMFLSYIKALVAVGLKMLLLCLCLGIVRNIMGTWPGMIAAQLESAESVFSFLLPMACALLGFYVILSAVPQFASSILSGSASGMDGGAVKAAAAAGYALGATVMNTSRMAVQKAVGGASTVSQAAQTFKHTSQAARDTGSTPGAARAAGAVEAAKTVMGMANPGGPRAAGEAIYTDSQRAAQFADVRAGANQNTVSAPQGTNRANQNQGNVTIAGSNASTASSGGSYAAASETKAADVGTNSTDSWGSFASDRKKS